MAHVQGAGNVWRRNYNGKGGRIRVVVNLRRKTTLLFPALVVLLFRLFGVVLFRDFHLSVVSGQLSVVSRQWSKRTFTVIRHCKVRTVGFHIEAKISPTGDERTTDD